MKKLITILAIMMVLVGAIFADSESHQIKITVTINETIPAFQLKYSTANSNSGKSVFTNGAKRNDNTPVTASIDFESDDDEDRAVTVNAYLANNAKQNASYTLTFSDGVFKDDEEHTVVSPSSITAKVGSGAGYGTGVSTTVNGAVATSTFTGATRCVADTLIAQAEYQYPKADIAPGTYTANIVMTVEKI